MIPRCIIYDLYILFNTTQLWHTSLWFLKSNMNLRIQYMSGTCHASVSVWHMHDTNTTLTLKYPCYIGLDWPLLKSFVNRLLFSFFVQRSDILSDIWWGRKSHIASECSLLFWLVKLSLAPSLVDVAQLNEPHKTYVSSSSLGFSISLCDFMSITIRYSVPSFCITLTSHGYPLNSLKRD